jgi:hypothetical protein
VPLEELHLTDHDKLIDVFHYHKEPSRWHGVPCKFVVKAVRCDLFFFFFFIKSAVLLADVDVAACQNFRGRSL